MRNKIWILLLFLLNNSLLLFSQHCHIGDIITNPDGSQGIVFYLNPDRLGGWMVALNDISSGCQWGSKEDIPRLPNYNAQSTDPLLLEMDGKENTRIIRAFQNNNLNYAAGKVDFEHGWYLPSIGQLRILYSKLALINSSLVANGGTVLGNGKYWSSTEHDADQAKTLSASQGCGFHSMTSKDQTCAVRAIRDFSFLQWSTDVVADSIEVFPTETTTYSVLLIEGSTCPNFDYTATIEVVVSPVPQDVTINPAGPLQICESDELHLQAQTSNNKNWSYLWRDLTTQQIFSETNAELIINDLSIGQHQIQVIVSSATNGNCSDSTMVEVEVFPPIEATLAGPALVCVDTEFDLAAEPIGEGLTYTWKRNGEVVPNWTGPEAHLEESIAGTYEYTVTISDGICTDESEPWTVVIEEIIPTLSAPVSICVDTQFDLVAAPTGDGYTYTWKRNGEVVPNWTSSTIHPSEAVVGTYVYSVTVADGICTAESEPVTVEVEDLTANVSGPDRVCVGSLFTLEASPAVSSYSYTWKRNGIVISETGASLYMTENNVGTFDYTVTISDGICTTESEPLTIAVEDLTATLTGPAVACVDVEFDLVAGPADGYTYTWKRNGIATTWTTSTVPVTEHASGQYEYTVTITNGICTDNASWTVNVEEVIASIEGPANVCPDETVTLTAKPDGMSYVWSNGSTNQSITVPAGYYTVTVTSTHSCQDEASLTVTEYPSFTASIEGPTQVCPGESVTLTAKPDGMSYVWSNGATSQSITVPAGNYSVTVTSPDNCSKEASHTLTEYPSFTASIEGPTQVCPDETVTLTAKPDGMSYAWSNGATSQSITVPAGNYSVTVTSPDNCSKEASHTLTEYPSFTASIEGPTQVCPGNPITLTAKPDGMSYLWSTGATSQTISVTPVDLSTTYSVEVTSADGCMDDASHVITLSDAIDAWIDGPNATCPGDQVTLTAKPDDMASYVWSTGETTQSITAPIGDYTVAMTSADGCEGNASHTVTAFPSVTASIEGDTEVCEGSPVTLTAYPDGMSYAWSTGETTRSITVTPDAPSQTYEVTVTSADGCSDNAPQTVTVKPLPIADAGEDVNVPYNSSAMLTAADAGAGAEYHWGPTDKIDGDPNQQTVTTVPLTEPTTFYLTVTLNGCESAAPDEVTVTVGNALYAYITADPTAVCPGETTTLTVHASNGTGNYTYHWTPEDLIASGQGTSIVTTMALDDTTPFTCEVNDGNETTSPPVTVTVFASVTASIEGDTEVCEGSPVTLTAYPDGMSYAWSTGETTRSITVTPDAPSQTYEVTVTSADGCSDIASHNVTVKPLPIADAGEDVNVPYNSSATLTAADAGAGAEYQWTPIDKIDGDPNQQTVTTVFLTDPQTFYLTVTLNGCESTMPDEVTVTVGDALYAYAIADPASVCPGSNTTLIVSASGGAGNNTYYWQPENLIASGQGTAQVATTDLPGPDPIDFTCLVTDEEGATYTAPVTVTLKPVPIADASGSDTYVSAGASATLIAANAGAGAVYHWLPDDFIATGQGTMTATTVSLNDPMTFYLTVTLDGCESLGSDEVTVSVGDALYATATADPDSVCPGNATTITVIAMGGTEPYTYEWTPNDLIASGQGTDVVTTTALSADQPFTCMVTDEVGAHYTASVTVTVKPLPTTDAGADQSVPYEGTATLTAADAGAGAEYHWEPTDMIDGDPNQQTVVTKPLTNPINTFQLTVTFNGCESADPDEVTVFVGDALYATAAADPESVCPGGDATLTVSPTGGTEPYTYEWQPQNYINGDPNAQTVTTTALNTDQPFTCTVTDQEGVTCTAQVTVTMKPLPLADASDSDHFVALGTPATLRAADAGAGAQYLWEPEDQIVAGQGTTTATTIPLPGPGPQPFYLTVTSPDGCINADLVNVEIGAPLDVTATADPVCQEEPALLTALPVGGTGQYTYQWEPQGLIANGQGTALATTEPLTESQLFDVTVSDGYDMKKVSVMVTVETPYVDTVFRSACHYYEWYGELYDEPGYHEHTVDGPVCDTTFVLYLEIVDEYNDTIPITACDHYDWNGQSYDETGLYTASFVSEQGCDSIVNLDLTIINPDIEILGYQDIYFSSDVWHGIYHYYVVDSIAIPLAPIQWQCDNPNWILLPVSDYHCKLIATTEGSSTLTAHTLIAENCDEEMSILINAKPYYDDDDDDTTTALFPNPARSEVTVQAKGITHVRMFNLMGQTVREIKVNNPVNAIDMDTGNLERGVYLVEITTLNEVVVERLVLATY
ncbi:MAG: T9SS type A sorting domain-containing protein [Bacteroidales bacterium]|nr:T9SS type A sorting domain-containing protein [Bacteroidales bacterium]